MPRRRHQIATMGRYPPARDPFRHVGWMIDDQVHLSLEQATQIGHVDLSQLELDPRVLRLNSPEPSRQDLLNLERARLDPEAGMAFAASHVSRQLWKAFEE